MEDLRRYGPGADPAGAAQGNGAADVPCRSLCLYHLTGGSRRLPPGVLSPLDGRNDRHPMKCRGCIADGKNMSCGSFEGVRIHVYAVEDDGAP